MGKDVEMVSSWTDRLALSGIRVNGQVFRAERPNLQEESEIDRSSRLRYSQFSSPHVPLFGQA